MFHFKEMKKKVIANDILSSNFQLTHTQDFSLWRKITWKHRNNGARVYLIGQNTVISKQNNYKRKLTRSTLEAQDSKKCQRVFSMLTKY